MNNSRNKRLKLCQIPTVYCGVNSSYDKQKNKEKNMYYYKDGDRYECLQKGYGAGMYVEKLKNVDSDCEYDLRHIKYINDKHIEKFGKYNINCSDCLFDYVDKHYTEDVTDMLIDVLTYKNKFNKKAYNSVIYYLYENGYDIMELPKCKKIR